MPVQVNGKLRARLTVPADAVGGSSCASWRWPIRRCKRTPTARRSARSWSPRDRWSAWSCRRCQDAEVAKDTETIGHRRRRLLLCLCALGVAQRPAAAIRWPGRGSFLPAYIKTIGVPTFVNRTTVFNLETMLTQKVRAEFIGRGKYQILPEATGVDALLTGEITAVSIDAGQLHARAARLALRDHDDRARSSCATCARTRCCGRTRA